MDTDTRQPRSLGALPLRPHVILLVCLAVVLLGVSLAFWPADPRPILLVAMAFGAWLCIRYLHIAAALLAFVVVGNLAGVATEQGLPSPTIALGGAILVGIAVRPDRWSFAPPIRLITLFGAYVVVTAASVLWAGFADRAMASTSTLIREMVLAAVVAVVVRRTGTLRLTLWAIVAATALLAVISTVQYLTGTFTENYLGLGEAVVANIVGGTDDWRTAGTIGDPNHYAQTLLIGLPIALNRGFVERSAALRVVGLLSAAVMTFAVYTTFSRGGALVLVAVLAVMLLRRRPSPAAVVTVLLATALVVSVLPADFRERIVAAADVRALLDQGGDPQDVAVRGRLSEVLAGLAMFQEQPLLGVGAGNYPARYQDYAQRFQLDRRPIERSAHSWYVEVAAETGIVGLAAFFTLLAGAGLALRDHARHARDTASERPDGGVTEALAMSAFAFLATSVLLHAAHARGFWLLLAIILCLPRSDLELEGDAEASTVRTPTHHLAGPAPTA